MSIEQVDIVIPSSPTDREDIFKVIKEMSNAKTRIESENEYIKEALGELEEKYGIKAKWFRQMLNDYHKDQFDKKVAEKDAYSELYEAVIQ